MKLTKSMTEELIDGLADKSLTFGCRVKHSISCCTSPGSQDVHELMYLGHTLFSEDIFLVTYKKCPNTLQPVSRGRFGYYTVKKSDLDGQIEILGHPIHLGKIINLAGIAWTEEQQEAQWLELVKLWFECGAEDSLQKIASRIEWEECLRCKGNGRIELLEHCPECGGQSEVAKPSPEASLLEFIHSLNLS